MVGFAAGFDAKRGAFGASIAAFVIAVLRGPSIVRTFRAAWSNRER